MLDPSPYYTTHRYHEQKQAAAPCGVSSGDSGHPWGREEGTGHQEPTAQHAHRPHVLSGWKPIKLYFGYTSTKRLSKEYIRNKRRPQVLSPVYSLEETEPWLEDIRRRREHCSESRGQPQMHTLSPEIRAPSPLHSLGPGMLCSGGRPKHCPKEYCCC